MQQLGSEKLTASRKAAKFKYKSRHVFFAPLRETFASLREIFAPLRETIASQRETSIVAASHPGKMFVCRNKTFLMAAHAELWVENKKREHVAENYR